MKIQTLCRILTGIQSWFTYSARCLAT